MTPWSEAIRFTRPLVGARIVESSEDPEPQGEVNSLNDRLNLFPYELEAMKAQAFLEGEQSGEKKALAIYESELSQKIGLCDQIATGLESLKDDLTKEMHIAVGNLVVEAVGRLLEGWVPGESEVRNIVEALLEDFDPGDHRMRIHLHPKSLELLSSDTMHQLTQSHPQLEFMSDSRLQPGECFLEGRFGLVDARYSEKLKNLSEVLSDE